MPIFTFYMLGTKYSSAQNRLMQLCDHVPYSAFTDKLSTDAMLLAAGAPLVL